MRALFAVAVLPPLLAACGRPAPLYVDKAYVRLPAVAGQPGVAYFTVHGGPEATRLLSVTSPLVIKSELHESMTGAGNMATMAPLRDIAVPARARLVFAPGGRHAMLYAINGGVKKGGTVTLVFTFADAERIEVDAPVIAAGDPPPKE